MATDKADIRVVVDSKTGAVMQRIERTETLLADDGINTDAVNLIIRNTDEWLMIQAYRTGQLALKEKRARERIAVAESDGYASKDALGANGVYGPVIKK